MPRLGEIACQSDDNALTEGLVNADRLLLDLCAEALRSLKHVEKAYASHDWGRWKAATTEAKKRAERQRDEVPIVEYCDGIKHTRPACPHPQDESHYRCGHLRQGSGGARVKDGAAGSAMSLPEDLDSARPARCPVVRRSRRVMPQHL